MLYSTFCHINEYPIIKYASVQGKQLNDDLMILIRVNIADVVYNTNVSKGANYGNQQIPRNKFRYV